MGRLVSIVSNSPPSLMRFVLASQFYVYFGLMPISQSVLIVSSTFEKALIGTFNQEKALVGAFSVITNHRICFGWNF